MRIERTGWTPLKGGRHLSRDALALDASGPVGDRVFCVVDPARRQVLRTVAHPSMLQVLARWDGTSLSLEVGGGPIAGVPEPTGDHWSADYWGRAARVEVVAGPWAGALSRHLGRDVVLAQVTRPGEVVYGAAVSIVTTSSVRQLSAAVGHPVDVARFRATMVIDTGVEPPAVERDWLGQELHLGSSRVRVQSPIPRCAVIDLHPDTGVRDARLLQALATIGGGQPVFGVDAVVTTPGDVPVGAPVRLP